MSEPWGSLRLREISTYVKTSGLANKPAITYLDVFKNKIAIGADIKILAWILTKLNVTFFLIRKQRHFKYDGALFRAVSCQ